ncbi:protein YgfX [Escherichia coli]|nr:protein YgfX [Escherichia coli]
MRVSWRAQWLSLLIHGLVAALVLLVTMPAAQLHPVMDGVTFAGGASIVFAASGALIARRGEIALLMDGRLRWQGAGVEHRQSAVDD